MRFLCLVFCSFLLSTSLGYSQTYRWIDENGIVSYSQTPPPSQEAEILTIQPQSQSDSVKANKELDNLRQKLEDQREDRQLASEAAEKARQEAIRHQQNCTAARSNLSKLEGLGTRLLKTADGQYVRLKEEERQSRIQTAKEQIKINCPH